MYMLKENATEISNLIALSKEKHCKKYNDLKAIQADNDWGASYLLAKLFFEGRVVTFTYISVEELTIFHKEFEKLEDSFDLNDLFSRFWLRIIGDIIEIPNGISSAGKHYEKVKDAEVEFNFLVDVIENLGPNHSIKKTDFLNFHSKYQSENKIIVSLEKCEALRFIEEKKEMIKVYNLDYEIPIFEFKKELNFLNFILKKEQCGDKNKLLIEKDLVKSIHSKHTAFFKLTPSLVDLTSQKLFVVEDTHYYLNLWVCEPDYWVDLCDKVGEKLWVLMKNSQKKTNQNDLVKNWILKMQFINNLITAPGIMKVEEKDFLLESCVEIVLDEADLWGTENEINKLLLSNSRAEYIILTNSTKVDFPDLTKSKNVFELFNLMEDCNKAYQSDLLCMQESRWFIDHIIQLVIFYDTNTGEDGIEYPFIRKLLSQGICRPYLLWKSCFYIHYWRPEIIPFLCLDVKVTSLAFNLYFISETDNKLPGKYADDIKNDNLWKLFELLLSSLISSQKISNSAKALAVFQCLIIVAEKKWHSFKSTRTLQLIKQRNNLLTLFNGLVKVLENKKLDGSFYGPEGQTHKYFFCDIIAELFIHVQLYNSQKVFTGGFVGLPLVKIDLLSLLLKLRSSAEYKIQKDEVDELKEDTIINQFLTEYTDLFKLSSIEQWNYTTGSMEKSIPLWSNNPEDIESIPWEDWVIVFEKHNRLPQFLSPTDLKLKRTPDKWEKENQLTVGKIRTHLEVLLVTFKGLRLNEVDFKQKGYKIETAIARVEQTIVDFVAQNSIQDTINGRIDIFNERYENTFFDSAENALIPVVAQVINKFQPINKFDILKSLTRTDSFTKCLKLLEFLSSETDRVFIKELIKSFDVVKYLDEKSYIPEIETVVVRLSEVEEFIDKAKEALAYWETRVMMQKENTEYKITHFRLKLLIAYHEGDEKSILNVENPSVNSFSTSRGFEFKSTETRDFYLGLVKLKNNNPEDAYRIFNRLIITSKNDKAAIAINRFYAHIRFAETKRTEEKDKLLANALQEWETYEMSIPKQDWKYILGYVQENIWSNKLDLYDKLRRHMEFDNLFSSLDTTFQLRKDFFEIRIANYINRDLYELAKSYIDKAKTYHQLSDNSLPEFIRVAVEKLENEDDYKRLRKEYQDLILRSPEKLILILPGNIAGNRSIPDFVLKEICNSANRILDIVNSVEVIDNEDKYTDLMILSLQSSLRNWYWKIGNARGGFSNSNKRNSGELDFVINSADNERIATCEALLLHGKNTSTTTTHAIKTFNYDHRRTLFFILAYYNGNNFTVHWHDYKDNVVPNITYPEGFPLCGEIEEINEPYTNNSIRILLAKHGDDTKVYHVLINLSYKISSL